MNAVDGEIYSIQHHVSVVFSAGAPVSSTNETDSHDLTEILLKMALNTLTITPYPVNPDHYWFIERHINIWDK
jgi:hypothetical protein